MKRLALLLLLAIAGTAAGQTIIDLEVAYRWQLGGPAGGALEVAAGVPIYLGATLGMDLGLLPRARIRLGDPVQYEASLQLLADGEAVTAFAEVGIRQMFDPDPIITARVGARTSFRLGGP